MNRVLTLSFLFLMLVGCATKRPDYMKPQLKGSWNAAAATVNGRPLPPEIVSALRLTLTENRYKTERGNEVLFDSTYIIDTSVKPNHINMLGTEGAAAGKEALGIYSLEGDYLRICYAKPGAPRPTAFGSAPDSGVSLVLWKRELKK